MGEPKKSTTVVWFRQDLRLADHPALTQALSRFQSIVPLYIWDPGAEGRWVPGGASRWWLHQSLISLDSDLRRRGSRLIIQKGSTASMLIYVARSVGATTVHATRRYEPAAIACEKFLETALMAQGISIRWFSGSLLFEPEAIRTKSDRPFQVFTPFWKACLRAPGPRRLLASPKRVPGPTRWPSSLAIKKLRLEPTINWAAGIQRAWEPGERGAQKQLKRFLQAAVATYPDDRNRPAIVGSSRLSPHLHFGEISPHQIWQAVQARSAQSPLPGLVRGAEIYLKEIGWREFAYHLLVHFPQTPEKPLRRDFERFPWSTDPGRLRAWQRGRTGFPLIDAGLRELWTTGWMHNRVRMIVGSFLVKDLLIGWQTGAAWFWDTLVDADLANNTLGWQWTAGCGADAAPYFRVFNPVLQGEKFDPDGTYVRKWVPELKKVPARWVHHPWEAPPDVLKQANVLLGKNYPAPLVDHGQARIQALAALARIKN